MKRGFCVLLAAAALSAAGFGVSYRLATRPAGELVSRPRCEMEWLRKEYHLNGAQFAKITQLHDAYLPGCADRCQRIAEAREKVRELIASTHSVTPEADAKLKEWASLENECRRTLIQHVFAVSAEMNPEDGARYVKMMTASIVGTCRDHMAMAPMK